MSFWEKHGARLIGTLPLGGALSERERRIVRATAQALFFDGERDVPRARLDWLETELADYFEAISETARLAMRLGINTVELSPWLALRRPQRLSDLSVEARIRCLTYLEHSPVTPLAVVFFAVKIFLSSVYFEHPEAMVETGFDGLALQGERPDWPQQSKA